MPSEDKEARREENRRRFRERENRLRKAQIDPEDVLQPQRNALLQDPNPCVRVCGRVSDGYVPDYALLVEDVDPDAFAVWLKVAEHLLIFEKAKRLGLAKFDFERRNTALGIGTRNGQQAALRAVRVEFQRMVPNTPTVDPVERQMPHETPKAPSSELTEDEMERLKEVAGFDDDSG